MSKSKTFFEKFLQIEKQITQKSNKWLEQKVEEVKMKRYKNEDLSKKEEDILKKEIILTISTMVIFPFLIIVFFFYVVFQGGLT